MSIIEQFFNRKKVQKKNKEYYNAIHDQDAVQDPESSKDLYVQKQNNESDNKEEEEEYEIVEREILPAKIICPDCGGITLEGLDFCDKCGGELKI